MKHKIIAGNWKMNMTTSETRKHIDFLSQNIIPNENKEVIILAPFTDLHILKEMLCDSFIKYGAQNFYCEDKGAYTGEVSADMLKDFDCEYVIVGHSERRTIFLEDDNLVNKKIKKALEKNLVPILCVGENKITRENNNHLEFVKEQIKRAFDGINAEQAKKVIIAYEPIWAIGTGVTATKEEAQDMCKSIRENIKMLYGNEIASNQMILYGGSVNIKNIKELMDTEDIDGALIGGASLKEEFSDIINCI